MKKIFLMGLGVLATASLIVSCADDLTSGISKGNGRINPDVRLNTETMKSRSASRAADDDEAQADQIEVSDLSLRISKADGSESWNWERIGQFDSEKQFAIGDYNIEAYYGDPAQQGFGLPAYLGSQTITVRDGEVTRPSITATLANSMILLQYTEQFQNYMQDWSAEVNGIAYGRDVESPIYVTPGTAEISLSIKKANGTEATFTLDPLEVQARYQYVITIDITNGAGDAVLNITFDESMDQDEIEIDLSDKLLATPAPEITPKGFENGVNNEVTAGMAPDMNLSMNIVALAGLKNVTMTTDSKSLVAQGWPAEIDLLAADGSMQSTLTDLGLKVVGLWKTPGEMAVIDFSEVIKHIGVVTGNNTTRIVVSVKDKLMRETKEPAELVFTIEDIALELNKVDEYFVPGENLQLRLSYNGADIKNNVKIQYDGQFGMPVDLTIVDVAPASRAMTDYIVTVKTPENADKMTIRAVYGETTSNDITLNAVSLDLLAEVVDNNVFATYAFAKVTEKSGLKLPDSSLWKVMVKGADGTYRKATFAPDGEYIKLTGLSAASAYTLKVTVYGSDSNEVTFNTEAATALTNGGMETWTTTSKGTTRKIDVYSAEGWATFNDLTTNHLTTSTEYSALNSTQPVTPGHNGQAALVRTVGFDVQTNAAGTNDFRKSSQGELFLGTYDGGANYGIGFKSRPAGLSFWYKYAPTNANDRGYAEITVLSASGTELAKNIVALDPSEDYVLKTLNLSYVKGADKASTLKVIFRSTNAGDTYLNSTDIPKHNNGFLWTLSDYYVGSQLYVDDIELIY